LPSWFYQVLIFRHMKKKLFFPALLLLSALSCNKDENYQRAPSIQIPDIDNMVISPVDTVIEGGYYIEKSIDLDVDKDNLPDFRLSSTILGSPGIGEHPRVNVASLKNDSKLFGKISNDTTFQHISLTSFISDNSTTVIYNSTIYSCRKIYPSDKIFSIDYDNFRISSLSEESSMSISDAFIADTFQLTNDWISYPGSPVFDNDTIFYYSSSWDNTCYGFPEDEFYYIGFMIDTSNEQKLGWIKIKIKDSYIITLQETAIQK
jgi:hypothetical protein